MYYRGASWIGTDVAENQIAQAKILAARNGMDIESYTCPAEKINYLENTFDAITACQCIWYPDHKIVAPNLRLKNRNGL
ncbi:MAG: class I SAM-dependent methyltransferase [Treponema sp.]|uniref:class I SAM-dependent methyltransferase n=1 Tax=Treponema sp. TaxID=166 RepID=UPI002A45F1D8|nr:class I SAM-dependent methyltransferase [Treponema sp.]